MHPGNLSQIALRLKLKSADVLPMYRKNAKVLKIANNYKLSNVSNVHERYIYDQIHYKLKRWENNENENYKKNDKKLANFN